MISHKDMVLVGLALAIILMVTLLAVRPRPYDTFRNRCIIENKELPRPDLYCKALWDTNDDKGGW